MKILRETPGSVLWLLTPRDEHARENLKRSAQVAQVDGSRLVFANKLAHDEYLARYAHADLFLDTWPYNAHTTASDALWAGLPVVTYAGETFASRVAASLLDAVGLPQLACPTIADYETRIIELAGDAAARQALRRHLVAARDTAPLFDSETWTRDFGRLLWAMAERWSRGLPPDHIVLASEPAEGACA
jgi:predicted O-linked N-acetylglucosamine transferase (SPINDLY family)